MTALHVKNMVCNRCIYMVDHLLKEAGVAPLSVGLGEVQLAEAPNADVLAVVEKKLREFGFELLNDQKSRIIEKIKTTVIAYVGQDAQPEVFSELLSAALHRDYSSLSKLFSEVEGITIEKYLIQQKIEKVKEWLSYDEWNLSEIAYRLGYSSVAHLSSQFKKTTGFTPSVFRKMKDHHRRPLDEVGQPSHPDDAAKTRDQYERDGPGKP
jgi:AraC-like DNA-binding protein